VSDDSPRCSFCHKAQDDAKILFSSPGDFPRAYICDECVAVCAVALETDPQKRPQGVGHPVTKWEEESPPKN